jgi:hypothetical protein
MKTALGESHLTCQGFSFLVRVWIPKISWRYGMKTNLDSLFKTDKVSEKEGVWFRVSDEARFLVARFGGNNSVKVKQALAKNYKPFAKQIESGAMPAEREKEVLIRSFVDASLLDWEGIEIDGEVKDFDKDLAIKFFMELPELFEAIYSYASTADSYKEDLGNS